MRTWCYGFPLRLPFGTATYVGTGGVKTVKRRVIRLWERATLVVLLGTSLVASSGGLAMAAAASATSSSGATASAKTPTTSSTAASSRAAAASKSGAKSGATKATTTSTQSGKAVAKAPVKTKVLPLPKPPAALNPNLNLAPFTLPVNGFATAALASGATLDQAVLPLDAVEQPTYFAALQQWDAQGAKEVPPSTQVTINPATDYRNVVLSSGGTTNVKIVPPGTMDGNTTAALGWPDDVTSVDFPFTVPTTGLYQLSVTYDNYKTCYSPGVTTLAQINSAGGNVGGQFCGRGTGAERGIQIDPPGTVPTLASSASKPPVATAAVTAAEQAGLSPSSLPGFINPLNAYQPVGPSPAWAVVNPKDPKATPCGVNLTGPGGTPTSYNGWQYIEARQVLFDNVWKLTGYTVNPTTGYVSFKKDNQGDDLQPIPQQVGTWQTVNVRDALGIYRDPLLFCLTAGQHVLRLDMVREPMAISSISFHGVQPLPTYQQALQQWQSQGLKPVTCGLCVTVQGENIYRMSDPTIQPGSTSDPAVVPNTNGYKILNMLNGQYFNQPNEWVEYKFTVPQSGLYELSFHELQAGLQGLPSGRAITIDGKTPFDGAQWIEVPFKNAWNVITIAQPNGKPALLGLTKGTHTLRIRITMGLVGQALTVINQATQRLGELLREIEMITGPVPSPVVQYNLPRNVPGLLPQMHSIIQVLRQQAALLNYAGGGQSVVAANSIDITANDLQHMAQYPNTIQLNLTKWANDEQSLATWSEQLQQQPMSIDWFVLSSPGARLPSPSASIWKVIATIWDGFILSFYRNYTGVGSRYGSGALSVWVGFGQLWAAIMSQMAASEFTPATGIHVNFNVVPGGSGIVLLDEASGHGPDVATGMPATVPLDFALRNGALDFSTMPGWNQVSQRFVKNATLPYQYTNAQGQTGVYGVPETQDVWMLMYRSDILKALGLPVPSTWPEVEREIPTLTNYGMEFYYPGANSGLAGAGGSGLTPFMDQYNGQFYIKSNNTGGYVSGLNTPASYQAFTLFTNLFLEENVPVAANFFTRFQTGEMPMGVANFGTFLQVYAGAPELNGLWKVAPMPGVPYECTSSNQCQAVTQGPCAYPDYPNEPPVPAGMHCFTNFSSGGDSTAVIIPRTAKHPKKAWEFVKWWTSAGVQLEFANDLEALGGATVAWNSANVQALQGLPFPEQDLKVFNESWTQYKPVPQVPGGYISARYINDVWTNVVINGENLRQQLQWAVQNINDELYRQQSLYGLVKRIKGKIVVAA